MGTGTSAVQVWPNPRVVTITTDSNGQIYPGSQAGDIDLIGDFTTGIGRGVTFTAPVRCNRDLYRSSPAGTILAGETIPVGVKVREPTNGTSGTYIFTEVI